MAVGRATKPIREASGIARGMLWAGAALTLFFVLMAIFAPLISPYGFDQYKANGARFAAARASVARHWIGTTVQSTDVLSRVVWGAQTELEVVVARARVLARHRRAARAHLRLLRRPARPRRSC